MTSNVSEDRSVWPYRSLLLCGHFGPATPASRRLNRETFVALGLLAVTVVAAVLVGVRSPVGKLLFAAGVAVSAAWVVLAFRRYFAQLDELSLRIQHEAIAFSFGMTLLLGAIAGAVSVTMPDFTVNPLWVMIAEPLRGIGLVLAARRYR